MNQSTYAENCALQAASTGRTFHCPLALMTAYSITGAGDGYFPNFLPPEALYHAVAFDPCLQLLNQMDHG